MSGTSETDLTHFETRARGKGFSRIAGVDEVGRGPLAGPVVAVAVVLPDAKCDLPVADSKALSTARRQALAEQLWDLQGIQIGLGIVEPREIDRINILRATHLAMRTALHQLDPLPHFALVDGLAVPDLPVPAEFIVRGDARSVSIAAASIVAKVYRDELMIALDAQFPGYGFAQHKGYGTAAHLAALQRLGPCPVHRQSFSPVKQALHGAPEQLELPYFGSRTESHRTQDTACRPRGR